LGDEHFIPFYEMRILAGRNYMKSDTARELVITEGFARAMGFQKPAEALDQQLQWRGVSYPIVGVVADFHQQSMREKIPHTFLTTAQHTGSLAVKLKAKTAAEAQLTLGQMAQYWKEVYPDNKFEFRFLDDTIAKFYVSEQKTAHLVNLATFIAILISCMGLFGLIIFITEQRRKEIGIRKVLGASVAGITGLLAKDFLKLVVIAIVIASPIAYYFMQKWLADFAYRIDMQWWMFAAAGALALLIAFLTVSFQSVRAALANPVKSLRSE
jgi:putative ABC transport system permease protein